ncbi:hypothetical protein CRUP_017904, partial [Coryphaenoides rupestris]
EQALHAVHSVLMLVDKDTTPRPERQPGLQMDVVTSLKALNKMAEAAQLTADLGGTFAYSHADWLQLHQREGGAILARFRREDLRLQQSEDCRDAVEAVTSLYNQVEEKLHTLVMRSNQSLQNLEQLLRLREVEGHINAAGIWFNSTGEEVLKDSNTTPDNMKDSETALQNLDSFLTQAKVKKQAVMALVAEVESSVEASSASPAADVFRTVVGTFRSNMDDLLLHAEKRRKELDVVTQLHRFCQQ